MSLPGLSGESITIVIKNTETYVTLRNMRDCYVYIMTNKMRGTLYTGVTSDLIRRVYFHKIKYNPKAFSAKYSTNKLVYYEQTNDITAAIAREKRIKHYNRQWKINLINKFNPKWEDLYPKIAS